MFHVEHLRGVDRLPLSSTRVKRGETEKHKRRWMRVLLLFLFLLIAPLVIWMIIESKIVNLMVTDVWLGSLPREFDGVKILFVTDLHMDIYASAEKIQRFRTGISFQIQVQIFIVRH